MLNLLINTLSKFLAGVIITGLLVFLPAGTLAYYNGWLFMAVLFVPMLILGLILFFKNPELLELRLKSKENSAKQSSIVKLSGLLFLVGFIAGGLCYRFDMLIVPKALSYVAAAAFLCSYALYAEVMRENVYLSRIIEVQEGQKVVDTGLYGIVRHPMYAASVLMFLSMPLILGSLISFLIFLGYPIIIAARIKGEEEFLERELQGYREYKNRVRYRMIPFIW